MHWTQIVGIAGLTLAGIGALIWLIRESDIDWPSVWAALGVVAVAVGAALILTLLLGLAFGGFAP